MPEKRRRIHEEYEEKQQVDDDGGPNSPDEQLGKEKRAGKKNVKTVKKKERRWCGGWD